MADVVSPEVRSRMMAGIRGVNTKPELMLRKGLFADGLRYRLHVRSLPGKPDIVFPRFKAVLFTHGCFWHGHDCPLFKMPSSRREFWEAKILRNREVDARSEVGLRDLGWRYGIIWECALKGKSRLPFPNVIAQCSSWLHSNKPTMEIRGAR
ncbi:very short patch repair endonuclease [Bradyrhizobium sp. LA7.1]|uniref:very short patch repair endonuclease n=1 Tax=Bradyrhizobium sp. LA7.1 TaxID=3156324 RepID=UPI00339B828D